MLLLEHFSDFKKIDVGVSKNFGDFYMNEDKNLIMLNYEKDFFKYSSEIPEEKIWEFKDSYEFVMARELRVSKINRKNNFLI